MRKLSLPLEHGQVADRISDYKPELDRLAEERKNKSEADKKAQIDRLMKDMSMSDKPDRKGDNPFGPHPMHERVDL